MFIFSSFGDVFPCLKKINSPHINTQHDQLVLLLVSYQSPLKQKNKKKPKQKKKITVDLTEILEEEMADQGASNAGQVVTQHITLQQPHTQGLPKDEVVNLEKDMADKIVGGVSVFNNQGYATYTGTIPFAKVDCADSTECFNNLVRGKLALPFPALPFPALPFPAFPVDTTRTGMNTHEFYIWFCQAAGMGYILDRLTLSAEKISSENAMRYGIGTLVSYKINELTVYPMSVVDKVTFAILKSAYPASIMTEALWITYNQNQKFSYLGTIFNYTFMTRTSMTVTQLIAYSYAKFCFTMIGKEPSTSTCNLVKALTGAKADFYFTPVEIGVWDDMACVTTELKQEMLKSMFKRPNELTELFEILYNRFKTYGLTSMITITEAIDKFPHFPWDYITSEWYHGEMDKYMSAAEAVTALEFPALYKDVLTAHPVTGYRKLAGFCAKVLEFSGVNNTLRNHEGLKRIRLPDDRVQYIKGLVAAPIGSRNQRFSQTTYDRLKRYSMKLCGANFDDPNIAASRQSIIDAKIREREEQEQARMQQMLQQFHQQVGPNPAAPAAPRQ